MGCVRQAANLKQHTAQVYKHLTKADQRHIIESSKLLEKGKTKSSSNLHEVAKRKT